MVPANSTGISPVPAYSGFPPTCSRFPYRALTSYGRTSQCVPVTFPCHAQVLLPRSCRNNSGLGCSAFARHYSRNHSCFLLLRLLRCFSSAGLPPLLDIPNQSGWVAPFGHPRISPACGSPRLFAAYHVLLRLWEPRHPPCALVHLLFTHARLLLRTYALFLSTAISCRFHSVAFSAQHVKELIPGNSPGNGNVKTKTIPNTGFQKGGVPAAPSGTATLLRLSPSYRFYP